MKFILYNINLLTHIKLICLFFLVLTITKMNGQIDLEKEKKKITSLNNLIIDKNPNYMYHHTLLFDDEQYIRNGINY